MEFEQRRQFKIDEKGLKSLKNEYSLWTALTIGIFLFILSLGDNGAITINGVAQPKIYAILSDLAIILIFLSFCIFLQRRKIDEMYYNYLLTLDKNIVKKLAYNKAEIMNISDIYEITRSFKGGLYLKSKSKPKLIFIPCQIENRYELEVLLRSIGTKFTADPYKFYQRHLKELFLLFTTLLSVDFAFKNIYIIVLISVLLIVALIAAFLRYLKSRRLNKRPINLLFNLIIFSFTAIVLFRLIYILLT